MGWRRGPRLQDGLFQVASQTCNILVKVNNHTVRHEYGCAGPPGTVALSRPRHSPTTGCLQTVVESGSVGAASSSEEELEQWEQIFMMRDDSGHSYHDKKKRRGGWCRPSLVGVLLVVVVVCVVVVVPVLDAPRPPRPAPPPAPCAPLLTETVPEGHMYPPGSQRPATGDTWLGLLNGARHSVDIASFYWTLRYNEIYPYNTSIQGEEVFQALISAARRGVAVRIAQNHPDRTNPNTDTDYLQRKNLAQVRSLNFSKLFGGGVLHTKFWIVDNTHIYIGSANMDWRSLSQVKELGVVAYNCSCLADDLAKVFQVYWALGVPDAAVPPSWPSAVWTSLSRDSPALLHGTHQYRGYISSSPPPLSPRGRTDDAAAIVGTIEDAESYVYVAVMDYIPATEYTPAPKFWPVIDSALRRAAIDRLVEVRLLVSYWRHSRPEEDNYLRSLVALHRAYPGVRVYVKRFLVPSTPAQQKIPFARVNHNKYMVTDVAAYIGTSNWSGDYFIDTAGVALVLQPTRSTDNSTLDIRADLQDLFERDWNSPYAVPVKP